MEDRKITGYMAPSHTTKLCFKCFWGDVTPSENTNSWIPLTDSMECRECGTMTLVIYDEDGVA
jgi:hypothetical protein